MKWFTMTMMQDETKPREDKEINGQLGVKFCR